jgi:hypothetical protein
MPSSIIKVKAASRKDDGNEISGEIHATRDSSELIKVKYELSKTELEMQIESAFEGVREIHLEMGEDEGQEFNFKLEV